MSVLSAYGLVLNAVKSIFNYNHNQIIDRHERYDIIGTFLGHANTFYMEQNETMEVIQVYLLIC